VIFKHIENKLELWDFIFVQHCFNEVIHAYVQCSQLVRRVADELWVQMGRVSAQLHHIQCRWYPWISAWNRHEQS
jgi:uncharacterized phage-associated protein